jgi:hypothetical protein
MEESDTYLAILEEGQAKGYRKVILIIAEELWGVAEEAAKAQLQNITDLDRLERMIRRAAKAAAWEELLQTP